MNNLYELIKWPESQEVIEKAHEQGWYKECILANSTDEKDLWIGGSAYFVPKFRMDLLQRVTRENISNYMLIKQLSYINKTKYDIIDDDRWRFNWTITRKQHIEFKGHCIKTIKRVFKCNRRKAEEIFDWFNKEFGLRIKN